MSTQATRRAILAGVPSLVALAVGSSSAFASAVATDDPIFAAIARHKDLRQRWSAGRYKSRIKSSEPERYSTLNGIFRSPTAATSFMCNLRKTYAALRRSGHFPSSRLSIQSSAV